MGGGHGTQLAVQVACMLTFALWSMSTSGFVFFMLKMVGWLRLSEEEERAGLDMSVHGGPVTHKVIPHVSSTSKLTSKLLSSTPNGSTPNSTGHGAVNFK